MTAPARAGAAAARAPGSFRAKYEAAAATHDSLLCVGLDPDPERIPAGLAPAAFLEAIVEATADLVCCYKPNAAFFESRGPAGVEELRALIAGIAGSAGGVPVLLDAKRGDVGHTATHYARAVFEQLGADAVTVNPYLGRDAIEPFLAYEDRHSFVLCRSSNAGARDFQDLVVAAPDAPDGAPGRPLYLEVAARAAEWNARGSVPGGSASGGSAAGGNVGLVVGATYPEEARAVRALCPELLVLMPGVGAQEGALRNAVSAARDAAGGGLLVNASRSVLYASAGADFAIAARGEAERLRDAINAARSG